MFVLLLSLIGCDSLSCSAYPVGSCGAAQVCCSSSECLYEADGQEFFCDGTDCAVAAEEFTSFCASPDTGE